MSVARSSLDVLISPQTGHIIDVRKDDPFAAALDDDALQPQSRYGAPARRCGACEPP